MYAVESDNRSSAAHKEASANKIKRDEQDIQKLINCFTSGLMTDPFSEDAGQELLTFATGVVLPTDIAENLLNSTEEGREQMDTFVKKRLNTSEGSFWDPVPNLKIKSFSTSTKKTNIETGNDKFVTRRAGAHCQTELFRPQALETVQRKYIKIQGTKFKNGRRSCDCKTQQKLSVHFGTS